VQLAVGIDVRVDSRSTNYRLFVDKYMKAVLPIIFACAGLVSIALVVIFELTKTPKQEADMIKREDEALSKVPDDPREMARWVP
jgi:hypothetical protein